MKRIARMAKVRAWTSQGEERKTYKGGSKKKRLFATDSIQSKIEHVLVFDTETTIDELQKLNFGSAVYMAVGNDGKFHEICEYLIYADDLPERDPNGFETLKDYVARGHRSIRGEHAPEDKRTLQDWVRLGSPDGMSPEELFSKAVTRYPVNEFSSCVDTFAVNVSDCERLPDANIRLISQTDFNYEVMQFSAFPNDEWSGNKPATVVGFNLPFDLSRIALGVAKSRKKFAGGFSFKMKPDAKSGDIRTVKRGIKGAMFSYTGGKSGQDYFTDVGTLGFGLTNNSYTLANAAKAFGVSQRKMATEEHGRITLDYIHYCRQDVRTTAAVYVALAEELDRHPIELEDNRVYSPASIAKAYLSAMGVPKPFDKQPDFPDSVLGYSMATFYGGRAEAHIRKVGVPVIYTDVTSMYPTVNACMKLWDLLISKRVEVREDTENVRALVEEVSIDRLFDKSLWPEFRGIVLVQPDDDLFPVRSAFKLGESETIGIGYVSSERGMWYSLPDVINAKINGGKTPKILRAFRFYPEGGPAESLTEIKLGGDIPIDPRSDDFFQHVIEQKQLAGTQHPAGVSKSGCMCLGCRNKQFLKVLANAGGYGIFVEINREDDKEESVETIYGVNDAPWEMSVYKPETPGGYCFPPIGTLITGAARLVLGMIEKLVTDAGGTWAMCDTDSFAIVATPDGGYIAPKPVIPPIAVDKDYPEAIPVLTYEKVEEIRQRFDSLSPYDPDVAGPIPILKREYPESIDDPQVYCYAISAKRYALYNVGDNGDIEIISNKEHGLGQYLNPEDPRIRDERGSREWVRDIWRYIILTDAGRKVEEPYWFSRPVMARVSVSTWSMYEALKKWNDGKDYQDQIKPYGFVMSPVVESRDKVNEFRLIGPFNPDASQWGEMGFFNIHDQDSREFRISTEVPADLDSIEDFPFVQVKNYGTVVADYRIHPEYKFCDANGEICDFETIGILHRHHVDIVTYEHQGKESNLLEAQVSGILAPGDVLFTEYGSGGNDFLDLAAPVLNTLKRVEVVELVKVYGKSINAKRLTPILDGRSNPRVELKNVLVKIAVSKALEDMADNIPERDWTTLDGRSTYWREICAEWIRRNK
ncbi:DNA polymerase [Streptomyces scabiei]|uniref:DNA polymerase n=1 Tax=Streptomyces scabiei TaxID=1930 RepID=UPI0038F67EEB